MPDTSAKPNALQLEVGQAVYWEDDHQFSRSRPVKVEKVGRKWIHLSNSASVGVETLRSNTWPFGRIWMTEAEFRVDLERRKVWRNIRNMHDLPKHVSLEDLQAFEALLKGSHKGA